MRGFPLFQIKYTPRSRCKLHKLAREKQVAAELAALEKLALERAAAAAAAEEMDDEEDEENM